MLRFLIFLTATADWVDLFIKLPSPISASLFWLITTDSEHFVVCLNFPHSEYFGVICNLATSLSASGAR